MSSFGAAHAASAKTARAITSRETLWTGGVVRISIPKGAEQGLFEDEEQHVRYLQFPRSVRGGRVNMFVQTAEPLQGETILAAASLMKKVLDDGLEYLYIDLVPVPDETPVTHQLLVVSSNERPAETEGLVLFETPAYMDGVIAFLPKSPLK
ncbi:MAG TPA: hypothetical protein PK609_03475 [Candidatus Paceibacterota bacterium]|nr:hypothetical protein [Candidatus Paceibacterota bacterium]